MNSLFRVFSIAAIASFLSYALSSIGRPNDPALYVSEDAPADVVQALFLLEQRVQAIESLLLATGAEREASTLDKGDDRHYGQLQSRATSLMSGVIDLWQHLPTGLPIVNGRITSPYAVRLHPIHNRLQPHYGIDIGAPAGTPILATAAGTVTSAGWSDGYGHVVDVDHGNGLVTRYAHASRLLVSKGESVQRGDTLALVGSTGLSTGPHLHYEVFRNGYNVNPMAFVAPPSPFAIESSGD